VSDYKVEVNALGDVVYNPLDGESNRPRTVVIIDGDRFIPLSWTATITAHGATNSASVVLDIAGNPDFSAALYRDPANASNAPVYIEIWAGFPTDPKPGSLDISEMKRWFLGIVDMYSAKFAADRVTFSCRSLAASLVDSYMTNVTGALTSVQFVQQQAAQIGMTANIQLPPGFQPVTLREVYARQFEGGSNFQAEIRKKKIWDVILECAQFDNVDVWESNDQPVINYAAPELVDRPDCTLSYGSNIEDIEGTHSIEFNKNVVVKVFTYQRRTRTTTSTRIQTNQGIGGGITVKTKTTNNTSSPIFGTSSSVSQTIGENGQVSYSVSSSSGGASSGTGAEAAGESGKQVYKFFYPNLDPTRVETLAKAIWRKISMLEYAIDLPKQAITTYLYDQLAITSYLSIFGLPYVFFNTDTLGKKYWPREIVMSFEPGGSGWTAAVKAVNHTLPSGAI
jgi:hypothetical protein